MSEVSTINTEKLNTIREIIADFDKETEIIATNLLGRIGKMFCNPYEVTQEAVEDTADKIIEREFSDFLEKSEEKPFPSREIESFISLEALADELGVSKPTVSTVKCKLGIPGTRVGRSLLLTSEDADRIRAYPFRRRGSKASEEVCSESESKGEREGSDDGADFGDTEGDCSADGSGMDGNTVSVCASSEGCETEKNQFNRRL